MAWKLSEKGHEVTVFEKRDKIGKEACSGLFSERILDFIPQSQKLIQNQINFVLIHFPKKTVRVNFARKFFIMNHADLDRLTADLAQKSGAKIQLSHETRPDLVSFERVIGCDGANSEVRKYLGLPEPKYRLGILGFVAYPERAERVEWVETWPVKRGFIWKITRREEIEYGIIARLEEARNIFDEFLAKNKIKLERISSALIPQGLIIPKNDRITLCGDAAGLTKPWSGGGVIWGLTAADLLLKNFPDLLQYRQAVKKAFYFKINFSKLLIKAVYFLGFSKLLCWLLPKRIKIEGDKLF